MNRCKLLVPALLAVAAARPLAQDYPTKPVKVVVPYAPGGLPDTMARLVGAEAGRRASASSWSSRTAAAPAASSAPRKSRERRARRLHAARRRRRRRSRSTRTCSPSCPTTRSRSSSAISLIGTSPLYLVAHPSVPANNMKELIALVKAQPGKLSYGSSGIGSIHHLATEALKVGPRPRHRARAVQGHRPVGAGAARRAGAAALLRAAFHRGAREGRHR